MKKYIVAAALLSVGSISAQKVGINTEIPKTTLEVLHINDAMHQAGVQAPRLSLEELTNKGETLYGKNQEGALVYITDVSGGSATGQREEIVVPGYYVLSRESNETPNEVYKWQRVIKASEYTNLYLADGALTNNRIVTQNGRTLTFNTSTLGGTTFKNTSGTEAAQQPAIQIIDGAQAKSSVLMSDELGNGTWQEPSAPVLTGSFADGGRTGIMADPSVAYKTGASITLPVGKWAVSISTELNLLKPTDTSIQGTGTRWGVLFLSTMTADTLSGVVGLPSVSNTPLLAAQDLNVIFDKQKLAGSQIVEVTGAPQTFNVYFISNEGWGVATDSNFNATGYRFTDSFKASSKNTYFFAVKLQ